MIRRKTNINEEFTILLMLFVLCESMMNKILITVLPVDNILGYAMVVCAFVSLITSELKVGKTFATFYLICWMVLGISYLFVGGNAVSAYIFEFLSFGTCGIVCALSLPINYTKFLKRTIVVTILFLAISMLEEFADAKVSQFNFGYALMPGVLCTFMLINFLELKKHPIKFFSLGSLLVIEAIILLKYSSRGTLVAIFVFAVLVIMVIWNKKIIGMVISMVGAVLLAFIEPLLLFLYQLTQQYGITISAIAKSYYLITAPQESLTHGRSLFLDIVLTNTHLENILIGHGVGAFENLAETYTHNIFLEAFFEVGIIGVIISIILYVFCIKKMFCKQSAISEKQFYMILFVTVMVKLLFSSTYWRVSGFWLLMVLVLGKGSQKINKDIKGQDNYDEYMPNI